LRRRLFELAGGSLRQAKRGTAEESVKRLSAAFLAYSEVFNLSRTQKVHAYPGVNNDSLGARGRTGWCALPVGKVDGGTTRDFDPLSLYSPQPFILDFRMIFVRQQKC
jgi:hypothetical protein